MVYNSKNNYMFRPIAAIFRLLQFCSTQCVKTSRRQYVFLCSFPCEFQEFRYMNCSLYLERDNETLTCTQLEICSTKQAERLSGEIRTSRNIPTLFKYVTVAMFLLEREEGVPQCQYYLKFKFLYYLL
jgi:hypothetical protein